MLVNEFIDFIFKNYHKRIRFSKENSYYSMKYLKNKNKKKTKKIAVACEQIGRKNA